jgi:hypothetical protein
VIVISVHFFIYSIAVFEKQQEVFILKSLAQARLAPTRSQRLACMAGGA